MVLLKSRLQIHPPQQVLEARVNLSWWLISFLHRLGKFLSCLIAALFAKTIALRGWCFAVLILVIIVIPVFTSTNLHESYPLE